MVSMFSSFCLEAVWAWTTSRRRKSDIVGCGISVVCGGEGKWMFLIFCDEVMMMMLVVMVVLVWLGFLYGLGMVNRGDEGRG